MWKVFFDGRRQIVNKSRFLIKAFGGKSLPAILALVLLLATAMSGVARSQSNEAEKQKVIREVAEMRMDVGEEQYKRGYFEAAEKTFLEAQAYEKYLTAAQRKRLNEDLEKTHIAILERKRILDHIRTARELVAQGQLTRAKVHLEKVKDSKSLAKEKREQIVELLKIIDNKLAGQKKK